jgi:hypothetical protein
MFELIDPYVYLLCKPILGQDRLLKTTPLPPSAVDSMTDKKLDLISVSFVYHNFLATQCPPLAGE